MNENAGDVRCNGASSFSCCETQESAASVKCAVKTGVGPRTPSLRAERDQYRSEPVCPQNQAGELSSGRKRAFLEVSSDAILRAEKRRTLIVGAWKVPRLEGRHSCFLLAPPYRSVSIGGR